MVIFNIEENFKVVEEWKKDEFPAWILMEEDEVNLLEKMFSYECINAVSYTHLTDKDTWFSDLKEVAVELGYATDRKKYKKNPEEYKGMVSDVAGAVRAALTHRANTPDLYTIMQIMGEEAVRERFKKFLSL